MLKTKFLYTKIPVRIKWSESAIIHGGVVPDSFDERNTWPKMVPHSRLKKTTRVN